MALAQQIPLYTEDDYYNTPEDFRTELIDGVFYNQASPSRTHQEILGTLYYKIRGYIDSKGGSCKVYPSPFAVKLSNDRKTIVEPDISVICDKDKLTDRGCTGAPDWIIEIISPSTSSHDYIRKLNLYADTGVREYWIVNPQKQIITVWFFGGNDIAPQNYTFKDKIKVNIYDDLYIDFNELDI